MARWALLKEKRSSTGDASTSLEIVGECFAHFVAQRQGSLGSGFSAADLDPTLMPNDVVKGKVCDLTGANAKSGEKQQDCPVSKTEDGIARARVYHLVKLLRAQVLR